MLRPYINLLISEMSLRVLKIEFMLIKASIIDGQRLILHYIDMLSFSTVAIFKTILMAIRE